MSVAKEIIAIIDKRIDSFLKNSNCVRRYSGQVIGQDGENKYEVKLLGYDTIYSLPARPYIIAKSGSYVLIESKINNLSNGIIVDVLSTPKTKELKEADNNNNNNIDNSSSNSLNLSKNELLDFFYPIGTIYETVNSNFNPSITWGGTWELVSAGVALRQAGAGENGSKSINTQYGTSEEILTIAQMAKHYHPYEIKKNGQVIVPNSYQFGQAGGNSSNEGYMGVSNNIQQYTTWEAKQKPAGENQPHNNIGPSLAVNIWKRVK